MEHSLTSRLSEALDEYMEAFEAGRPPDREALLTKYGDLAGDLRPCLDALDLMCGPDGDRAPDAPRTLGDFELIRAVGRGGMGVVYEAEQISLRRRVALKMLPFASVLEPRHLQRFRNEAQAAAHLHHNHIVPVYAVGCERGVHHYAMQFIDGVSVAGMIRELREGRDPSSDEASSSAISAIAADGSTRSPAYGRAIARLGRDAAEALDHAHERGVVHRDIKPANLLLDTRGSVWITDFGLASFRNQTSVTVTGDLVGTLRYMSPEQASATRLPVDHRTDVYSLGATLYECLTLEPAFPGDDPHLVLGDIASRDPEPPRRINGAVPVELETILLKCLAKEPRERYATARDLADDLDRFLEDKPIRARRPSLARRVTKWGRRHRGVMAACAVALLLGVAGLAVSNVLIREQRDLAERRGERVTGELARARRSLDEILAAVGTSARGETSRPRVLEAMREFWEPLLASDGADAVDRHASALAYWGMARILFLQRGPAAGPEARAHYEEALRVLRELADEDPGNAEYRSDLARIQGELGRHLHAVGDASGSEAALRAARSAWKRARDAAPEDRGARFGEAIAIGALGDYLEGAGRNLDALRTHGDAYPILRALVDEAHDPAHREELARCFFRCAVLYERLGNPDEAYDAHVRALNARKKLHEDHPGNEAYRRAFLESYLAFGPAHARKLGVLKPAPAFEPKLDPSEAKRDEVLTDVPVPLDVTMPIRVAGARMPEEGDARFWIVTHRGSAVTDLMGTIAADIRTVWSPQASFVMFCEFADAAGDRLRLTVEASYDDDKRWTGTYAITGGTGKYAGAFGKGDAALREPHATLILAGSIARR